MKSFFRKEDGVTLVELLAALSLAGILLLLISNIFFTSHHQYEVQTKQIDHEADVRYAMNAVTKAVRKTDEVSIADQLLKTDSSTFELRGSELLQDDSLLAQNIDSFKLEKNGDQIRITIESTSNGQGRTTSLTTALYIRE
ncbi:prepilin-type N-terminal cleavage/methylation domain-containing protein [Halobacillus sp. KGW1]|uniref:prepilin-type N-terminal cleavage/methylation domain-containing protein n=1 Tax=Halobacillus sp. KGW1 TaxID=1793726 RepID=UPI0007816DB1|nr:prepilin-type N-terminal cleavage/methylation domain-containing protein [Halobacillus sp. KGW1]